MRKIFKILMVSFLFLSTALIADAGSLSITIFKDGKPLSDTQIVIDAKNNYTTDSDGSLHIFLDVGKHKVEIFGKEDGLNLGYFKRSVEIKLDKDTQITAEFSEDDSDNIDIDTPFDTDIAINKATGEAKLSGVIISADTKKIVSNARIFVMGTDIDAITDAQGRFSFKVPSGVKLNVSFIHSEHTSQTLKDVVLTKDSTMDKTISLTPASMELEEFVILAPKVSGSIASVMAEEKKVNAIVNILSSEQMSKKGDSDAASALKRVTGVTLIGGKDIYVRGLGDRYSSIEMNSMPLPSPDPLKRSVPLDIFPAGAISSMKVQKSSSANIPSNFGGGYIDIRTKDSSKKNYIKISLGINANTNTGSEVYTYKGSDGDTLGFDDGYREIDPSIINATKITVGKPIDDFTTYDFTKEEISSFTQKHVNRDLAVKKAPQPFGYDIGIEGSKNIELSSDHRISLFGNYKYKTDSSSREEEYKNYDMRSNGVLYEKPTQYGTNYTSVTEYVHNTMFYLGYNYGDALKVKYTKLYTHNAEKVTKVADGIMGSNDEHMTKYYLNWEERTLNVDQINSLIDYKIFDYVNDLRIGVEVAEANLYQPNNYHYTYRNEGTPFLDNKISNNISNKLESNDDLFAYYLKNKFNFELLNENGYIDFGISASSKDRTSKQNKYFLRKIAGSAIVDDRDMTGNIEQIYDEYVRPDIEYDDRSLRLGTLFQPADRYNARVDESNIYISTFLKPFSNIEILIGARNVSFTQEVDQYIMDDDNHVALKTESLKIDDIYPSASIKYKLNKDNQFDFAFSKTFIVPDLREFTSGEYFHPYEVATIVGNPELTNTDIMSFDLKYAHYFSDIENVKLGFFYKYLDKPIEDVMKPSSSLPIYSFDNADSATMFGIEIDGRKELGFLSSYLENFYLSGNFSLTESTVTLTQEQKEIYSTNNRQLQGLSPIVINFSFSYETEYRSIALSFNKMGKRIRKVGMIDDGNAFPDYEEDPAPILDLALIEKFKNGFTIKGKLANILQAETIWTQGANVTNSFSNPMSFSLSASYRY
jgi:hypothetical protein